jgi:hypothetical protein
MGFMAGSVGFMGILGFDAESTIPARRSGRLLGACHLIKKSRMDPVFFCFSVFDPRQLGRWDTR